MRSDVIARPRRRRGPTRRAPSDRRAPRGIPAASGQAAAAHRETFSATDGPSSSARQCEWPLGRSPSTQFTERRRDVVVTVDRLSRRRALEERNDIGQQQRLMLVDDDRGRRVKRLDIDEPVSMAAARQSPRAGRVMSMNWVGSSVPTRIVVCRNADVPASVSMCRPPPWRMGSTRGEVFSER